MKKISKIKRLFMLALIFLLSINSFAAIVSDNDGSAFVTKAEFDALKNSFTKRINDYNASISGKLDGAIAAYLTGITFDTIEVKSLPLYDYMKYYNATGVSIMWQKTSKNWNEDQYYANDWILQVCSGYSMNSAKAENPWHQFNGYISKKNTNNNANVCRYKLIDGKRYISSFEKNLNVSNRADLILYFPTDSTTQYWGSIMTKVEINNEKDFPDGMVYDDNPYATGTLTGHVQGSTKTNTTKGQWWNGQVITGFHSPLQTDDFTGSYGSWYYKLGADLSYNLNQITTQKFRSMSSSLLEFAGRFPMATTTDVAYTGATLTKSQLLLLRDSADTIAAPELIWAKNTLVDQNFTQRINILFGPLASEEAATMDLYYKPNFPKVVKDTYWLANTEYVDSANVYDYWVKSNWDVDCNFYNPLPLLSSEKNGTANFQIKTNTAGKYYITEKYDLPIYDSTKYTAANLKEFGASTTESGASTVTKGISYTATANELTYFSLQVDKNTKYYIFFVPDSVASTPKDIIITPNQELKYLYD